MESNNKGFERGIGFFKNGKFEDAVKEFTILVDVYRQSAKHKQDTSTLKYDKNYVNVLDCLSACYMKLNKVEKALRYAKTMVMADQYNPKGYLRLHKTYLQLNDNVKAYEVLKKGYLKVRQFKNTKQGDEKKVNENLYEQLKLELKRQKDSLNNATENNTTEKPIEKVSTDPLRKLPLDLIEQIFGQFSMSFKLQCFTVSSFWRDTLLQSSNLFEDFQLRKGIRKQAFEKCIKFIINHNQKKKMPFAYIRSINIEPHASCESSIISTFLGKRFNVRHLSVTLNSCNFLALHTEMKKNTSFLNNLRSLKLDLPLMITDNSNLETLLRECYNLTDLTLIIPKFDTRSKKPTTIGVHLESLMSLTISIGMNAYNSKLNLLLLDDFLSKNQFPRLEHLALSRVSINKRTLSNLLTPNLKSIQLDSVFNFSIVDVSEALVEKATHGSVGKLSTLKIVEADTTMYPLATDWFSLFDKTKIYYNLSTLMLRGSCIPPRLLDDLLKSTNCNIENLHLVLNCNLIFENNLASFNNQQPPMHGYCKIDEIIAKIPKVKQLSLVGFPGFNNSVFNNMVHFSHNNRCFEKLEYLNISMNKIDGNTLIRLFRKPNSLRLQKLVIQYCQVDPDMVEFIRKQKYSLSVDYKMSDRVIL